MNIPYIRSGDYFILDLKLPEELRPIGRWGRMHRDYLKEHHPTQFNTLVLSVSLWTYLADLNEQAQQRMETLITQLKAADGITEALKVTDPMEWTQRMNNIRARASIFCVITANRWHNWRLRGTNYGPAANSKGGTLKRLHPCFLFFDF